MIVFYRTIPQNWSGHRKVIKKTHTLVIVVPRILHSTAFKMRNRGKQLIHRGYGGTIEIAEGWKSVSGQRPKDHAGELTVTRLRWLRPRLETGARDVRGRDWSRLDLRERSVLSLERKTCAELKRVDLVHRGSKVEVSSLFFTLTQGNWRISGRHLFALLFIATHCFWARYFNYLNAYMAF